MSHNADSDNDSDEIALPLSSQRYLISGLMQEKNEEDINGEDGTPK